ncbi:MAG TPA: HIT family protein [Candidatus Nanoarchaeia archaeon]|nr:HIT family protein [Candidatus Nanoarchaeia archaeon]
MADFNKLKIKEGKYWDVFLHEDQSVPGCVYFWYKDETTIDLLDIPEEAFSEFFSLAKEIKEALMVAFKPTMFNYLALNNNTRHLHIHMIPRYGEKIEVFGITFEDKAFGKSYKRNLDFKVSEEFLIKLKELIQSKMQF